MILADRTRRRIMPASFRFSQILPWLGAVSVAVGMSVLLVTLYRTAQQQVTEQANQVLEIERSKFLDFAHAHLENARDSALADLVSFHEEGLSYTLGQWDDANEIVIGTFNGDPKSLSAEDLRGFPRMWEINDAMPAYATRRFDLRSRPDLLNPPNGYQNENMEMANYAGRAVAPAAGWAASRSDPASPWLLWYRVGPEEPVRGAWIDTTALVEVLKTARPSQRVAHIEIVAQNQATTGTDYQLPELPALGIRFARGDVFETKRESTRLVGLNAGLLFVVALLGVGLLIHRSQRNAREARQKTTFVSLVSHELRTPVTSIRMFADMLTSPGLTSEKHDGFIQTIQKESSRLADLIDRLLTLNRLSQTERSATLKSVNIGEILREIVALNAPLMTPAGLTLRLDCPAADIIVNTQASTVHQAMQNLLDNAVKYAPNSGEVLVRLFERSGEVVIQVSDQGPGIPHQSGGKIFEPYVQGQDNLHDKPTGLGLGLAIARTELRALGGDLVLASCEKGATFEITLPSNPDLS
ncbi:MAG: hypothetical protein SynsKO_24270 [Synoicihabitans sp.]